MGYFQPENIWTITRFNKAGVGKEMKDHGFSVASADNLWRRAKFPATKVTVIFLSLEVRKQSDTLDASSNRESRFTEDPEFLKYNIRSEWKLLWWYLSIFSI